jgi:hypothetical protein
MVILLLVVIRTPGFAGQGGHIRSARGCAYLRCQSAGWYAEWVSGSKIFAREWGQSREHAVADSRLARNVSR